MRFKLLLLLTFCTLILATDIVCEKVLMSKSGQIAFIRTPIADNMVLQRDMNVTLFGESQGGEGMQLSLTILDSKGTIHGRHSTRTTDKNQWRFVLNRFVASGPYTLMFASDSNSVNISNVMFGDVFLCSGQSNMEMPVWQNFNSDEYINSADQFANNIRLLQVKHNVSVVPILSFQGDQSPQWTLSTGPYVRDFSALCYFFARRLILILPNIEKAQVTIGLIHSSFGGTPVEAWSSEDALSKCPPREIHRHDPPDPHDDHVLFNAMISPLLNTNVRSIMWYQGESNSGQPEKYRCLFGQMILDWRRKLVQGLKDYIPSFNFVQLAAYSRDPGFIMLRWSQELVLEDIENTGMATAIDLGDPNSPFHPIHPRSKDAISARMLLVALYNTYGQKHIDYSGPRFVDIMNANPAPDGRWSISFNMKFTNGGVYMNGTAFCEECCTKNGANAFQVVGKDQKIYSVEQLDLSASDQGIFTIVTDKMLGTSPMAIFYAWYAYPQCAMYEKASSLPAPPFTDRKSVV